MPLFSESQRALAERVVAFTLTNPFLPERIDLERETLGDEFVAEGADWNLDPASAARHPNLARFAALVDRLVTAARGRLSEGGTVSDADRRLHESLCIVRAYYTHRERFDPVISRFREKPDSPPRADFYDEFVEEFGESLGACSGRSEVLGRAPHLFAVAFQLRRAYFEIINHIIGVSPAIVRLRAAVWQSIFSHDVLRYLRGLYQRINDITTLVTGPSGTGKELVASAIASSHYVPFDAAGRVFTASRRQLYLPLNLSAMSPTLIESELFGHRKGSFTGATADRTGWLESCTANGTVFLDEIGELDGRIQVKLLRVLQSRTFQPIGDTAEKRFVGKVVAATNRDLAAEMAAGRFRADFYYRLCSDMVATPSLSEQVRDCPEQLAILVRHVARRILGAEEAEPLVDETLGWIEKKMPVDYAWPGNVRELEQCVWNIMMHRRYEPAVAAGGEGGGDGGDAAAVLGRAIASGSLTMDQLIRRYTTLVYRQAGTYEKAAERLGVNWRTVKSRVELDGDEERER